MKVSNVLLALFLFSSQVVSAAQTNHSALSRSNRLLHFLAKQEGFRDMALSSIIGKRCSRYMDYNGKAPCKAAVNKMIEILDFDIILSDDKLPTQPNGSWKPSSFVFVAFKSNLIRLLSSRFTTQYLYNLNQQLYSYLSGEKSRLNIWDLTKEQYKTDYFTALVMATLFQDTSLMKLHLAYLEQAGVTGNANFDANKELLSRVIDTINFILDNSEENYRELFYPHEIQANLNRNIYHFYVPLFLAKSLENEGVTKEYAYSASLMLTLSYEFITSAKDYRYLLTDPETLRGDLHIKDIFGGYCGANIGVRGMNFNKSYESIKESFSRSTKDAVQMLLRH